MVIGFAVNLLELLFNVCTDKLDLTYCLCLCYLFSACFKVIKCFFTLAKRWFIYVL